MNINKFPNNADKPRHQQYHVTMRTVKPQHKKLTEPKKIPYRYQNERQHLLNSVHFTRGPKGAQPVGRVAKKKRKEYEARTQLQYKKYILIIK